MISEKEYIRTVPVEHRKKFAQFFTPEPVARIMVDWLLKHNSFKTLLEPAFGLGIFSQLILEQKENIKITGFDTDHLIFNFAQENFKTYSNITLYLKDYLFNDWENKYDAIVCNPPYLKFHDYENTRTLDEIKKILKITLSGFTNIYTLFLLKSIYQLKDNGRIAYIIPSEFLNSDYGTNIKEYLLKSDILRHVFIFDFKENIFDNALTTSAIFLLAKDKNDHKVHFSTITNQNELHDLSTIINAYPNIKGQISLAPKEINPQLKWRTYYQKQQSSKYKNLIHFKRVAKVVRGIATGANDYFTFNLEKAKKHKIKTNALLPCITKSKDVKSSFFTGKNFDELKKKNCRVYLFNGLSNPDGVNILKYIKKGEDQGINKRYLTSKRNPWYMLENRPPSPILVGVFNRNGLKFIRNEAETYNLTTFHCIYPVKDSFIDINIDLLFAYLLTDVAHQIFNDNRREYGDGLKKFEPNDLNNALMLDLSRLDRKLEIRILELYSKYKYSVFNNKTDSTYLERINQIFVSEYKV